MKTRKTVIALVLGIALAAVMAPAAASAATLTASGQAALEAQAAKKTVYVIVRATGDRIPTATGYRIPTTYKYNSKGLLFKEVDKNSGLGSGTNPKTTKYIYDAKGNLSKKKGWSAETIKLNADGTMASSSYWSRGIVAKTLTKFKWKSGRVKTSSEKTTWPEGDPLGSSTYKYTYKDGRVASVARTGTFVDRAISSKTTYKYDKAGNLMKITGEQTCKIVNSYDKAGRLVRQKTEEASSSGEDTDTRVVKYKYKAVKVPAAMVSKVKAQQWALVNRNLNFALGAHAIWAT